MARRDKENIDDTPGRAEQTPDDAARMEGAFTATGGVTVAAILHIFRLVGAELVLARGIDIAQLEQAVRAKLGEFTSPTTDLAAREAGLAHARFLVDHVLTQIRAQADLKRSLAVGTQKEVELHPSHAAHPASKLLN